LLIKITINGSSYEAEAEERLVDVINRVGKELPQVCYHPQLGPIQTCDTCLVEINGTLARACGTTVSAGMDVATESVRAKAAQREAFDRILGNHLLYCTVCDNKTGIARSTTQRNCCKSNINKYRFVRSLTQSTIQTLFTDTIRISAFSAAAASKSARTLK